MGSRPDVIGKEVRQKGVREKNIDTEEWRKKRKKL
jgi:hypothetical protein